MKEWVIQSISPKISIYIANISSKWEENIALFNILLKMQFHSIQFYQKIFYTNVYIFRFAQQISIKLWLLRDDTLWVWRLFFITQDHIYVTQNMWWALSLSLKKLPSWSKSMDVFVLVLFNELTFTFYRAIVCMSLSEQWIWQIFKIYTCLAIFAKILAFFMSLRNIDIYFIQNIYSK